MLARWLLNPDNSALPYSGEVSQRDCPTYGLQVGAAGGCGWWVQLAGAAGGCSWWAKLVGAAADGAGDGRFGVD
ncbi:MAG: hypothetical protein RSD45_00175, partial [Gordonibacter sp.]